ncbi:DUF1240 domain-containing protein [Superficieibacter sp.]|uniref:DUF1240 domain-containing protein n=1 Tax=Superficieibacter sp. TaxID=2303322 RepID=UPI0028AFF531|nr:DUF1240 domain-containing protein [Superficieibacter sp.]
MPIEQDVLLKPMTLKERLKFISLLLACMMTLTAALVFLSETTGATMISLVNGEDAFYYDWRDVLLFLIFPVMGYFEIFLLLGLFCPFSYSLMRLWRGVINIVWVYMYLAFFLSIPLSIAITYYVRSNYESCDGKGPLSGDYYTKDIGMCEQFKYHPEESESDKSFILVTPEDTKIE